MTTKLLLSGLVLTGLFQSCVINKEVYTTKLSENFENQKEIFVQERGLQDSKNSFDFYFSDNNIEREYEIISYNHVSSWLPFKPLIFKKWQMKYRLHQYMHNAFCLGVLPTIDGMIVEPDLNGVNYIRYKDSDKEPFVIPAKQDYVSGVSFGAGVSFEDEIGIRPVINGSYFLSRNINCLKSIRHEFGVLYRIRKKVETNNFNIDRIKKNGGFFSLNYRSILSYNLSEYFSNTWNKGKGNTPVFTEIGLNMNLLQINRSSNQYMDGSSQLSLSNTTNTTFVGVGVYFGFRFKLTSKVDLNLSASNAPLNLLNFESAKYSENDLTPSKSKFPMKPFKIGNFMPEVLLRLSFEL